MPTISFDGLDDGVRPPAGATQHSGHFVGLHVSLAAGSRDAALVLTLEPGAYTFSVAGVGGTTGVALVEVYLLP